jgi:hypothetical protein
VLFVKIFATNGQDSIALIHKVSLEKDVFYLSDEYHFQKSGRDIDIQLLEFYVLDRNVRNVFIESGHVTAYIINRYLETGDENFLCQLVLSKTYENFVFFLKKARQVYKMKKFKFYGIDHYSFHSDWNYAIRDLLKRNIDSIPEFRSYLNRIEPIISGYYNKMSLNNFKTLNNSIAKSENCYRIKKDFKNYFSTNRALLQKK